MHSSSIAQQYERESTQPRAVWPRERARFARQRWAGEEEEVGRTSLAAAGQPSDRVWQCTTELYCGHSYSPYRPVLPSPVLDRPPPLIGSPPSRRHHLLDGHLYQHAQARNHLEHDRQQAQAARRRCDPQEVRLLPRQWRSVPSRSLPPELDLELTPPLDPAVLCFCNTEPRIQATRRVTRKESSPNLGREFWSCGSWIEEQQCGFFLWCDQAATCVPSLSRRRSLSRDRSLTSTRAARSLGRGLRTPPPTDKPALPPLAKPIAPATSPQKRPRARSPPAFRPSVPAAVPAPAPASTPTKARQQQPIVTESFDDVDFDSLDAGLDDDIEDDDDSPSAAAAASPSKKPRFESFGPSSGASRAGTATPATSQHWQGAAASPSSPGKPRAGGFDAIRADPDSPFHALQKELFGGGDGGERGPASSPAPASPSKAAPEGATSSLESLSAALASAAEAVEAVKKEREKDARLQVAAKRKEEALKKAVERAKEEGEAARRENERLKERIRCVSLSLALSLSLPAQLLMRVIPQDARGGE